MRTYGVHQCRHRSDETRRVFEINPSVRVNHASSFFFSRNTVNIPGIFVRLSRRTIDFAGFLDFCWPGLLSQEKYSYQSDESRSRDRAWMMNLQINEAERNPSDHRQSWLNLLDPIETLALYCARGLKLRETRKDRV